MARLNAIVVIVALVVSLAVTGTATAQTSGDELPPHVLLGSLQESKELYVANKLRMIRKYGKDRLRLDQAAVDRAAAVDLARFRAGFVTVHLRKDTDGDGQISAEEVRVSLKENGLSRTRGLTKQEYLEVLEKQFKQEMTRDANGDGYISIDELLKAARRNFKPERSQNYRHASRLLAVDPNKDGVLTVQELQKLAVETFDRFDRNGNGWIDLDEKAEVEIARSESGKLQSEEDRKKRRERSRNRGTK